VAQPPLKFRRGRWFLLIKHMPTSRPSVLVILNDTTLPIAWNPPLFRVCGYDDADPSASDG
jgi:hypothetical protein